ncbi:MAG TPA: hypothetical protein VG434_00340 [Sphingomicrobium sp.]|nr:hypothetical protein [Sphingomicrobium sp.]
MRFLYLVASAMIVAAQPSFAQTAVSPRDGSHDFDFALGSWTTEVTIIKDPFNKPDEQVHMRGTKVARPIWNGKGWIEEIGADGPSGHWQGATIFLYDPAAHQWSQNYVDSSEGHMEAPSIGEYRDGKLEFYSQESVDGRAMLLRGTWTVISKDLHTYEIARSIDGGRSWHTSFIARVRRAK